MQYFLQWRIKKKFGNLQWRIQEFPVGWGGQALTPKEAPTYCLTNFSPKLPLNEKYWAKRGGTRRLLLLNPQMERVPWVITLEPLWVFKENWGKSGANSGEILDPSLKTWKDILWEHIKEMESSKTKSTYILILFCKSKLRRWTFFTNKLKTNTHKRESYIILPAKDYLRLQKLNVF